MFLGRYEVVAPWQLVSGSGSYGGGSMRGGGGDSLLAKRKRPRATAVEIAVPSRLRSTMMRTGSSRQLNEFRMPSIVAVHLTPSLTRERYEEVVSRLTGGKRRLRSPSDLPFEGLVVHATAQTETGFFVFDVFESQEAVDRFNDAMHTIPRQVGIQEPPKFYPAHTFIQR